MPIASYLPEHMGSVTLSPAGPLVAGSHAELTLTYTAGKFGIDDTGMLKISWRTTSDMAKPQFTDAAAPNYSTVEASNGAKLEFWIDRLNVRPWVNTLLVRIGRGFLRAGETITVRLGDRSKGSPGLRLQTNCEECFELKVFVDAFATYQFTEIERSPGFALVPGPAARWKAILPSLVAAGEPFRLAVVAEDLWGNPTAIDRPLLLVPSQPIANLPKRIDAQDGPCVLDGLMVAAPGEIELSLNEAMTGARLAFANPLRVTASPPPLRRYWGDLHAQSGETVGTNPAESYFSYARDKAFVDIVGHQGNDFQITDAFWQELNRLTAAFDKPGRFVCVPGYEWSGNTGLGGDRNVFYRREGRPIHRSSRALVPGQDRQVEDCYTASDLFRALAGEDAVVIAHVGGRYADICVAHDGRLERAVEVHSTWGTFEWLLHDAFAQGYRVGVVCHSDDHKGRPGATHPGASTFGAIGGLTCYLMPELTRDTLFDALRARRHYGTTGTRLFMDLRATFAEPVTRFSDDPQLAAPAQGQSVREAAMGDIIRPGSVPMHVDVEVIGTAPVERLDILHGAQVVETVRPFTLAESGCRVRVLWQGAEYRGRGRETHWLGKLALTGNRIARFAPVNFLNPERQVRETSPATMLEWTSVTTGNLAGIDLWLNDARAGVLDIETNIVSGRVDLAALTGDPITFEGGGLDRKLSVYRLPDADWSNRVACEHTAKHAGSGDLPVYVRVTQVDGHQAWSSPIYLVS